MEIRKFHPYETSVFTHCDRTYLDEHQMVDGTGASAIDPARTHLNFNVSENNRHSREQMNYIIGETGKKPRKNAVVIFSTWVTLPRQYEEHDEDVPFLKHFFTDIYDTLLLFYGLTPEDIASAWVHLDETTPHMHFLATPLVREPDKTRLSFDDKVTLVKYHKLHPFTENMMIEKGWTDCRLLTGTTRDGELSFRNLKRKSAIDRMKEIEEAKTKAEEALQSANEKIRSQKALLLRFEREQREKEEKIRGQEEQIQLKNQELDRLNQDLLIVKTNVSAERARKIDTVEDVLIRNQTLAAKALLEHPERLTAKDRQILERVYHAENGTGNRGSQKSRGYIR